MKIVKPNLNSTKVLKIIVVILILVVTFELGVMIHTQNVKPTIQTLHNTKSQLEATTEYQNRKLNLQDEEIEKYLKNETELTQEINELEGHIAGLNTKFEQIKTRTTNEYPFAVPTSGIVATFAGTYGGNMMGIEHWGVDIWTTLDNNGHIASHRGNPVYSVCDGTVTKLHPGNGAFTMLCDDIPGNYFVPAHTDVKIYYGHMGNRDNKSLFFDVRRGQRLKKGQKIGYQGDLSDVFPEMRNVHLHISIWSGQYQPFAKTGGPHNPCLYFGGECSRPGSIFQAE